MIRVSHASLCCVDVKPEQGHSLKKSYLQVTPSGSGIEGSSKHCHFRHQNCWQKCKGENSMTYSSLWYFCLCQTKHWQERTIPSHKIAFYCDCKDGRFYHACLLETQDYLKYLHRELLYYDFLNEIILTFVFKPLEKEGFTFSLARLLYDWIQGVFSGKIHICASF